MILEISALVDKKVVSFQMVHPSEIKQIAMYSHIIENENAICEVAIAKDYIILTTSNRSIHNINAYDWLGIHKWNISDIVGDVQCVFCGGGVTTAELLSRDVDPSLLYEEHEYYFCTTWNSRKYIIDLTEKRLIKTVETR